MPCYGNGAVTICTAPEPVAIEREPASIRWCWRCREHRVHLLTYRELPVESYYDSSWDLRCDRCDAPATDFHGNHVGRWSADDDAAHTAIVARLRTTAVDASQPEPERHAIDVCPECGMDMEDTNCPQCGWKAPVVGQPERQVKP